MNDTRLEIEKRMALANATVNSPNEINSWQSNFLANQGGILYVENGALKYRGSSGTITTLAVS
jgi:hypothetical protein